VCCEDRASNKANEVGVSDMQCNAGAHARGVLVLHLSVGDDVGPRTRLREMFSRDKAEICERGAVNFSLFWYLAY
jgi:hypothetical protein